MLSEPGLGSVTVMLRSVLRGQSPFMEVLSDLVVFSKTHRVLLINRVLSPVLFLVTAPSGVTSLCAEYPLCKGYILYF